MRATLGLAIASDHVGAVLVRDGALQWSALRSCDRASRAERIVELITACPRGRWGSRRVVAAIGPSGVQVRRLTDVPAALSQEELREIVRTGAGRFFLKNGIPLETSCGRQSDGTAWAAAYDAALIGEIEDACRAGSSHLTAIVPVALALRLATRDQSVAWQDGELQLSLAYLDDDLIQVRCSRVAAESAFRPMDLSPLLVAVGLPAIPLVPAYTATLVSVKAPLVLRRSIPLASAPSRKQLVVASIACALAFICCWLSPAVVSSIRANRAQHLLARLERQADVGRNVSNALDSVTRSLEAVGAFDGRARSMTLLLAEITRALPDSCTLEQLQVNDSTGGSVVAVGPRAAVVVDALERVPLIAAPTISGPVASLSLGGRSMERVAVAFRLADQ